MKPETLSLQSMTGAMANNAITENFTTDSWWWEAARPRSTGDTALPGSTDVVVIGAGYTGLSAALTLARADREVLVLDRLMPGEAASSRNAGFLGRSPSRPLFLP